MIIAIGMHEAPGGRGEDLTWLLREHGFRSDFAVVCELSGDTFLLAHMGQATVEITIARPGLVTHELKTAAGMPHPIMAAGRVIEAIARAQRRAGGDRAPVGRGRDVLPRRGARRRLLQPLPDRVPPRRHAPLGARQHARRRSRPSSASCSSRSPPRPAARSSSTSSSSAAPTRSTPSTQLSRALRAGYQDVHGDGAAAHRDQGRRRRALCSRARPQSRRSTTARPAPEPTATSSSYPSQSSSVPTQVYLAMLQHLWAREPPPSYEELRTSFRWQLPAAVNIGVEVADRQPRAGTRDPGHRRARDHAHRHLRRADRRLEPARQRARGAREWGGRPGRD